MGDVDDAQPEIRIGDRERREVDTRLQQAHADGVLTLTEYDERAAQCWAARTRSDLDLLTRDLPPAQPAPTAIEAAPAPLPAPTKSLAQRATGRPSAGSSSWPACPTRPARPSEPTARAAGRG